VHGTTQAFVKTGFTGKDFGQCAVDQKAAGQFLGGAFEVFADNLEDGAAEEVFHDGLQVGIVRLVDGAHTFGQDFAVAAVATENEIVDAQGKGHTDSGRFLSNGQVGGAGVVIGYSLVFAFGFYQVEHGLELTDQHHVVQYGF